MNPLVTPCGKTVNSRGEYFHSQAALDAHIRDCPTCNGNRFAIPPEDFIGSEGNPLDDLDLSDESDGVYHALRHEFGED